MDFQTIQAALRTVVAIPVTPFVGRGANLYADFQAYAYLVDRMVSGGITVVTPNGNTGEFYSLTALDSNKPISLRVAHFAQFKAGRLTNLRVLVDSFDLVEQTVGYPIHLPRMAV